jgi:hypothetical protein
MARKFIEKTDASLRDIILIKLGKTWQNLDKLS